MSSEKPGSLFNNISFFYGLFYPMQRRHFLSVMKRLGEQIGLVEVKTILDVGCGTGALCSALHSLGYEVTGMDPAERMLEIGKRKPENKGIRFCVADATQTLPFPENSFDVSIASFVAHGMPQEQRQKMYAEMSRVTKRKVIIYDYNNNRAFWTNMIEWLEGGDYFHFIHHAENEMRQCYSQLEPCFSEVQMVQVNTRAVFYVCIPMKKENKPSR